MVSNVRLAPFLFVLHGCLFPYDRCQLYCFILGFVGSPQPTVLKNPVKEDLMSFFRPLNHSKQYFLSLKFAFKSTPIVFILKYSR